MRIFYTLLLLALTMSCIEERTPQKTEPKNGLDQGTDQQVDEDAPGTDLSDEDCACPPREGFDYECVEGRCEYRCPDRTVHCNNACLPIQCDCGGDLERADQDLRQACINAECITCAGPFLWPVSGWAVEIEDRPGVAIVAPHNTPVFPARDGTVSDVGWDDLRGYFIDIEHRDADNATWTTSYDHLLQLPKLDIGDEVLALVPDATTIGRVSRTGAAEYPRLHFRIEGPQGNVALDFEAEDWVRGGTRATDPIAEISSMVTERGTGDRLVVRQAFNVEVLPTAEALGFPFLSSPGGPIRDEQFAMPGQIYTSTQTEDGHYFIDPGWLPVSAIKPIGDLQITRIRIANQAQIRESTQLDAHTFGELPFGQTLLSFGTQDDMHLIQWECVAGDIRAEISPCHNAAQTSTHYGYIAAHQIAATDAFTTYTFGEIPWHFGPPHFPRHDGRFTEAGRTLAVIGNDNGWFLIEAQDNNQEEISVWIPGWQTAHQR